MTHEDPYSRYDEQFHSANNSDEENVILRTDRKSVRDMILRFEQSAVTSDSNEFTERCKDNTISSLSGVINPIQAHFHQHNPIPRSQDRNSNVSVNSILSNISGASSESSSSGFVSDRKSGADFLVPHRPAPPPPIITPSLDVKPPEATPSSATKERRYSFATPSTSPVLLRRARQPPVIRRKSIVHSQGQINQGETLWSYGVRQSDLEKLLRLKRSDVSDHEEEPKSLSEKNSDSADDSSSSDSSDSDSDKSDEYLMNPPDNRTDTILTDHSTDTLINEGGSDQGDNVSVTSGISGERSNYDNVSIKSISSFDMVPYQKYDSITVSSDEFGSEVCHAPDTEFLTVSAVNEWCVSKCEEQVLMPIESKKQKYKRRLTERVKELVHTEHVYVDRLRHVVQDYIPEMSRKDLPVALRGRKHDVFANIEKICRFHADEFLPALKDCENDLRKLGQCFRRYEQRFNMYVMYSRCNKRATRLVFENKHFFQQKQLELGERLDLSSYLLEPVQRLPRYKLFLDDLVKTYSNYENEAAETESRISKLSVDSDETGGSNGEASDHDETPMDSLKQAMATVECLLTAIDDIMALENIKDCPPYINLLNQGRLLRQQEFYAMDNARRRRVLMRIFLFDKLVLLTAVYRKQLTVEFFIYKDHIPVDDLGITAKEHDRHKFTIWYKKRNLKSYKLETSDATVRNEWVEEITSLLWEQAMQKKELLLMQRNKRTSVASMNSQASSEDGRNDDKYNSLRGVPGEVRRSPDKIIRRTTWYCE